MAPEETLVFVFGAEGVMLGGVSSLEVSVVYH